MKSRFSYTNPQFLILSGNSCLIVLKSIREINPNSIMLPENSFLTVSMLSEKEIEKKKKLKLKTLKWFKLQKQTIEVLQLINYKNKL